MLTHEEASALVDDLNRVLNHSADDSIILVMEPADDDPQSGKVPTLVETGWSERAELTSRSDLIEQFLGWYDEGPDSYTDEQIAAARALAEG